MIGSKLNSEESYLITLKCGYGLSQKFYIGSKHRKCDEENNKCSYFKKFNFLRAFLIFSIIHEILLSFKMYGVKKILKINAKS